MPGVKGKSGRKKIHNGAPAKEASCSTCGKTKPGKAFYPNAGRRNRLSADCRDCNADAQLARSYRRLIRDKGADAMTQRIEETEHRLRLMRKALKEETQLDKEGIK